MTTAPLGLMGGTFDPVHYAHLRLAEEAADHLRLARVRWIPAGNPGHRGAPRTAGAHRAAMVAAAIAGNPRFELDDAEAGLAGPVFTIDTLGRLRRELGRETPLVFIMGADQLHAFHTWRAWRELLDLAHFAVGERPGFALEAAALDATVAAEWSRRRGGPDALAAAPGGAIVSFPLTQLAISASEIRHTLGRGRSARYLLPPEVLAYIASHHLYEGSG